uniref:Beta-1,4-galactosyltransferase n=1 Tax=Malurus cyaneus samueli TaxID=2593467 RepID=A0A8C5TIP7_9PASS
VWLAIGNFVCWKAGLFLKYLTLGLTEVGESTEGSTQPGFVVHVPVGAQLLVCLTDCRICRAQNRLCVLICLMCYTSLPVGALRVEFSQPINLDEVARINPEVKAGGRFAPKDCIALQKVAIIIPFRNREEHLKYWLYYLHPVLQRQQLDYGVYVINQDGEEEFNRAKLLNIGFAEALKEYDYDCFVFSDVDLIPMDDRNTYKCYSQPRHLSVSMDKFGFRLPYNQYFGGVSALSKEQFTKINGFPNNYWGWGGEDDDIYNSLTSIHTNAWAGAVCFWVCQHWLKEWDSGHAAGGWMRSCPTLPSAAQELHVPELQERRKVFSQGRQIPPLSEDQGKGSTWACATLQLHISTAFTERNHHEGLVFGSLL